MPSSASNPVTPAVCQVRFGSRGSESPLPGLVHVALASLAGEEREIILPEGGELSNEDGFCLVRTGEALAGFAAAAAMDVEVTARDLYLKLLRVTRGLHLYRIWNYVPDINATTNGLENYQRFCRARSMVFEESCGAGFRRVLPAASAVGTAETNLTVVFVAGRAQPAYFENPRQVPAFEYPAAYGPRSPSFCRAAMVPLASSRRFFVSGTSAIRGHTTVAPGDLEAQANCTIENLYLVGEAAGLGTRLGADQPWRRRFKVYLRHREDLKPVSFLLNRQLLLPGDQVLYLQADICRADLALEIEADLTAEKNA